MISRTQAYSAIVETDGVEFDSVSEKFNGLHEDYFLFMYKGHECKMSFRNNLLAVSFTTRVCEFERRWDLNKQDNPESFKEDVEYFLKSTLKKTGY